MVLLRVLKETFLASLPLAAVIVVVCGFVAPMGDPYDYLKLLIGYAGVVVGQSLFLVGLDISILPIGKAVGESLVKFKKVIFIVFFGFLFGLITESAEPALIVFARQVNLVMTELNERVLVMVMATGIGCFVGFALYRVVKDMNLKVVFAVLYVLIFVLAIFTPEEFIGIAFDGSGATTGDISVPFMLALGMGVAATMSRHKTNDDIFGIVGLASVGPILAIFVYGIVFKAAHGGVMPPTIPYAPGQHQTFLEDLLFNTQGVFVALVPIILIFLPFQFILIKLFKRDFIKILLGTIPVFVGLLLFLTCVDYGFAFAGQYIGEVFLASHRPEWFKWLLLVVGFVLGGAITLSEPAVTVLGHQLEEITNGHIRQMTIRLTLAVGIGVAAVIAVTKILTQISIFWFLVPLYAIALLMMKPSSKLFVGLAFDSGGVSGGALTSAFLTPLTLGIAQAVSQSVMAAGGTPQPILTNGFGIIAFISVTPLIAVQLLGLIYERKYQKEQREFAEHEAEFLAELLSREGDDE
ncbi:MAG: DUF1538 domain-containing protein [Lachnospiraceae bacterium]|nr:DUF1538 domain-containing protein [Lachnospiraceae bacterium]